MSEIRTLSDLTDQLDSQSALRKHELISFREMLSSPSKPPLKFYLRLSPVISYAHWEGYIKDASKYYLDYLSNHSVGLSRLKSNFQALACKQEIIGCANATKRIAPHLNVVRRLVDEINQSVSIPSSNVINTEDNLHWEAFENICATVGISVEGYWVNYKGLIGDMFSARCDVAHGKLDNVDLKQAQQYVDFVLEAIGNYTSEITNLALMDAHLR